MSNTVIYYLVINPLTIKKKKTKTTFVASNAQLSVVGGAFSKLRLSVPKGNYLTCQCDQAKSPSLSLRF